jgi:homoserine kinase
MDKIRVTVPATTANLGAGFDVFALALKSPVDLMTVEKIPSGIIIESHGYPIPLDLTRNCASVVASELLQAFNIREGVKIQITKQIFPGSGLGSSAASSVGAAYAINQLFTLNLSLRELAFYASKGEVVSAGVPHYDNVVAGLWGGFTITHSYSPLRVAQFTPPPQLGIIVILPNVSKGSTESARKILPTQILRKNVVFNIGKAAVLAAGMASQNLDLIIAGMDDCIVEPARAHAGLLRKFSEIKKTGVKLHAGIAASGAGPAILGIIEKKRRQELIDALSQIYKRIGLSFKVYRTEPGKGAHITANSLNVIG